MTEEATSPLPSGGSPTREQVHKWPTCERIGYMTPAVLAVPHKGLKSEVATRERIGYITPAVWGVRHKAAKSEVAHMGADWLPHPYCLGGHQRGDKISKSRMLADWLHHLCCLGVPHKGSKSYRGHMRPNRLHHSCRLGGPQQKDKVRTDPHVSGLATSPPPSGGCPTRERNQKGIPCQRIGYITPAVSGVAHKPTKSESDLHVGGSATSPLPSGGSPKKGQKRKGTTPEGIGYITPAVWGVPPQGAKIRSGSHVSGFATSPMLSWGSPPQEQNQKGATCALIGYITPAVWGVPQKGTKAERDHA